MYSLFAITLQVRRDDMPVLYIWYGLSAKGGYVNLVTGIKTFQSAYNVFDVSGRTNSMITARQGTSMLLACSLPSVSFRSCVIPQARQCSKHYLHRFNMLPSTPLMPMQDPTPSPQLLHMTSPPPPPAKSSAPPLSVRQISINPCHTRKKP